MCVNQLYMACWFGPIAAVFDGKSLVVVQEAAALMGQPFLFSQGQAVASFFVRTERFEKLLAQQTFPQATWLCDDDF